jgi:hypothetical protein
LDAPPVVSPSNSQPVAADIAVALAAAPTTAPKLPLPNSSTTPIRLPGQGDPELASFQTAEADPMNLIYLMADQNAPRQVAIPRGVQNTPRSNPTGRAALTADGTRDDGARAGQGAPATRDRNAPRPGGRAAASDAPVATGTPASAGTRGATPAAPRNNSANNPSAGAGQPDGAAAAKIVSSKPAVAEANPAGRPVAPAGEHAPDAVPNAGAAVIRISHPSGGNFDVVIQQSVSREDFPEAVGALSGNPVYTVYLKVGDEREWLLEYCIPGRVATKVSTYQVNIDDPGTVSAPYPVATVIPRNVLAMPHPQHIVLRGRLSTAGIFRDITASDGENPLALELLPLLSQWQFRPAQRDQVPVEVEILLIIPARS